MKPTKRPLRSPLTARVLLRKVFFLCGRVILGTSIVVLLASRSLQAVNTPDYVATATGSLLTGGNWSLGTIPTVTNDADFAFGATTGIRTWNSGNLTVGSLSVQATTGTFSIQNANTGAVNSTLTLGGPGNLGNSVTIRQANDLLFVTSGSTLNLYGNNGGGGTGVMGVTLAQANGYFDIDGTSNIGAVISDGGSGYGFTKSGAGTLTLSGANTYTGTTRIARGTLALNFADTTFTSTAPTINIISSSSRLTFDGESTLALTGKSGSFTSQTFNGTTLNGFGFVTLAAGANNAGSGVVLNLGAITRNAGGGINITQPTVFTTISATNGVTTTTANNASGILGGWATVGNTDFATNNGTNIVAYSAYTALPTSGASSTTVYNGGSITLAGDLTTGAIKFTTAGTTTLGAFNLSVNGTNGGILTTAAETIDTTGGGVLSAGSGNELILGGSATMTISGNNLIGANSGSLTKINSNNVIISGANSYTGGTVINSGTVTAGSATSLGTGAITFHGGVLTSNAVITIANAIITTPGTIGFINPGSGLALSGAVTGSGGLTWQNNGNVGNIVMNGDFSQFTGTLSIDTTNNQTNKTIGGNTGATDNLGQATLQLTGGVGSNRRLGASGVVQVGALQSVPGAGTFIGGSYIVGALNTNTSYGGGGTSGNNTTFTKVGSGSLTLNNNAIMLGNIFLNVNGGSLVVDESNLTTPTGLYVATALNVGGGTYSLLAKSGTATSQGVNGLTVNAGNSAVNASQNGGSAGVLLQLAAITRNAGGTVDFTLPSGTNCATNAITTTTANNAAGILGGYATVGGADWAVSGASATVPISAFTGYTAMVTTGGSTTTNYSLAGAGTNLSGSVAINSLKVTDTGASQSLSLAGNNLTFTSALGGLLYAGGTSNAYTIFGGNGVDGAGIIGGGTAAGNEFIVNVKSGSTLTITAPIIKTGAASTGFLTTAGGGTLILNSATASAFSGTSNLNAGTVQITQDGNLGTGGLAMNGGMLQLAPGGTYGSGTLFSNNRGIALGNNGGTIDTNGSSVSYGGVITGGIVNSGSANTAGGFSFTKAGNGTLTLTNSHTYGGATVITGGVLSVSTLNVTEGAGGGVASGIGEAPNTAPYLVLNGGTLQYLGTSAAATDRQFTLGTSGGGLDSSSVSSANTLTWNGNTGSAGTAVNAVAMSGVGTRTFTVSGSNTGANTFGMILGDDGNGFATSVTKSGAGTWVFSGANTYTGPTSVTGGELIVSGSLNGTVNVSVASTATLASGATGSIATASSGNVSISGTLAPGDLGSVGTLTLAPGAGGKLNFLSGSTFNFTISGATSDLVNFSTSGDWLGGSGNVALTLTGITAADYGNTYTVFHNVNTTGFVFSSITGYDTADYLASFTQVGSDYQLSFSTIPEPNMGVSLFGGVGLLLVLRRRGNHSRA